MYMYTQGHSRLISTGAYIPEKRVTSKEILEAIDSENRFGVAHDWLERAMGIRERRVAPDEMLPSDMATHAAHDAMETAGIHPTELDAIIFVGVDRDYLEPATAHIVQKKIGASNAVAFDVSNACHGFMNGIHLMDALIATGQARRGLIVTGEHAHRITLKAIKALNASNERNLFIKYAGGLTLGDAGAAMIMGPKLKPDSGFMGFMLQSQGQYSDLCVCGNHRGEESPLETDMPTIVMQNTRLHSAMYAQFMTKLGWKPGDINKFVHHQVGIKVFKHHAGYARISTDVMPNTLNAMGNLVTATIPMNLHILHKEQRVMNGDKLFLSGSGSGLAISQTGLIWDAA
ncbi:MAG: ketoacyl-ACP synthase III [Pseudomonadota bacterium]